MDKDAIATFLEVVILLMLVGRLGHRIKRLAEKRQGE